MNFLLGIDSFKPSISCWTEWLLWVLQSGRCSFLKRVISARKFTLLAASRTQTIDSPSIVPFALFNVAVMHVTPLVRPSPCNPPDFPALRQSGRNKSATQHRSMMLLTLLALPVSGRGRSSWSRGKWRETEEHVWTNSYSNPCNSSKILLSLSRYFWKKTPFAGNRPCPKGLYDNQ